jgi:hypothetical protein
MTIHELENNKYVELKDVEHDSIYCIITGKSLDELVVAVNERCIKSANTERQTTTRGWWPIGGPSVSNITSDERWVQALVYYHC